MALNYLGQKYFSARYFGLKEYVARVIKGAQTYVLRTIGELNASSFIPDVVVTKIISFINVALPIDEQKFTSLAIDTSAVDTTFSSPSTSEDDQQYFTLIFEEDRVRLEPVDIQTASPRGQLYASSIEAPIVVTTRRIE